MFEKYNLAEYADRLNSVAVRKAGDSHVAEDIVQDTFLAAILALSNGKEPKNLWGWLLGIMSNKYCDWLREKYNKPHISFEDCSLDIPDESGLEDDSAEELEAIRRELGYLSKIHREVMIRFYMHGDTIEKIACDLRVPVGTVKSRLNTGRKHIRERVINMENYTKQSYEPDILRMSCSGTTGLDGEPFSLVGYNDRLTQNILILAYPKPVTETEIAKSIGVPTVFIEPIIDKMTNGELMQRTDGGAVYTNFIIYTDKSRKSTFRKQLETVKKHFDLFWKGTEKALKALRSKDYYIRQSEHAKRKLELHFCIKLLTNACICVRDEVTGIMAFSEYPNRKNGGHWFAMGLQYPADYSYQDDSIFWKYNVDGESGTEIKNFHGAKYIELRKYDTELGEYPNCFFKADYVKWLYELLTNVPYENSAVRDNVFDTAENFIESGILIKEDTLKLDIPVLTKSEYRDECRLSDAYEKTLSCDIHDVLLPVFDDGFVKLPAHLKSVPRWQQYLFCGSSIPMAVIHKAIEKKLLFANIDYKLPAAILIIEE